MTNLIIGIDGGGTNCRAAVADCRGQTLGRGKSGGANIMTDPKAALKNIVDAVRQAFADASIPSDRISSSSSVLGLAGANIGNYAEHIGRQLPFVESHIETDSMVALQGALGDGDGAMAILGTGSVFMARRDSEIRHAGGWGFMVGDLASGARIGRALLQDTLLAHDKVRPPSAITRAVMAEFNDEPRLLVEFAHTSKPGAFGRFAPIVFEHAEAGDPTARSLVDGAVKSIDEALDAIIWDGCARLCLVGGLAARYREHLAARHRAIYQEPLSTAVDGALSLAAARYCDDAGRVA